MSEQQRKEAEELAKRPRVRHHIFPQEFKDWFKQKGINVHAWTLVLLKEDHDRIHKGARGGPWQREHEVLRAAFRRAPRFTGEYRASRKWTLPGVHCPLCDASWSIGSEAYPCVDLSGLKERAQYEEARLEEDFTEFERLRDWTGNPRVRSAAGRD